MQHSNANISLVCFLLLAISTATASAQQVQFAAQRGPYYVGEPVVVQLALESVDAKVDVACRLKGDAPEGLTIEGPQVNRSVNSFTQIINGRMSSRESISYQFRFIVTANKEGEFLVGPFEVTTDGKVQEVAAESFQFGKLANDPDMQIAVTVPQRSIYVGQEVPVTIRWSFAGDIDAVRHAFSSLQIRSPLFDQFSFREVPRRTRTAFSIATANGGIEVDAEVTQEQVDGRDFIVVTGTRTMVPDVPGRFTDIPITCRTEKVTEWGRSLFGDLVPRRSAPALAAGVPLNLVIKPVPQSGRPASFAGAVGRGFSIEVAANRSVVRLGDPISLNVTIRGDGNLASVSLPPLNENVGLASDQFQVPEDKPTGTLDGSQKQFNVNVRVKDLSVNQLPAIAFSWFDPYQEQFATAHSKPIALQVMTTHVVSSADVISSSPATPIAGETAPSNSEDGGASSVASGTAFVGANLAITRDPAVLLANGSAITAPATITTACYALAVMVVIGSIGVRRRASRDQETLGRKKLLRRIQGRIETAERLPVKEASAEIARALRDLVADFDAVDRSEIEPLIARCDNIIYTTGTVAETGLAEITAEARRFVREAAKR